MLLTMHEIMKRRKIGAYLRWPPATNDNTTAASRLTTKSMLDVWIEPKFYIQPGAKVFTIGSCFARNIEEKLKAAGMDVLSMGFELPPDSYSVPARPNAALNKYNTHSIEDELSIALKGLDATNALIEVDDSKFFDPLASHTKIDHRDKVAAIRSQITNVTSRVKDADLVIMTLGQNEVWKDLETGFHINTAPPPPVLRKYKNRFGVELVDFEENLKSLESTIGMLEGCGAKKVVITVSPVPMGTTLSKLDIISANIYSKSMLRVCAQYLYEKYDFVDYYPSYEIAIHSPRDLVWCNDQLHVTDSAVAYITSKFVSSYVPD